MRILAERLHGSSRRAIYQRALMHVVLDTTSLLCSYRPFEEASSVSAVLMVLFIPCCKFGLGQG